MRLFIAIPMPDGVKQTLSDLQQPIKGIRWQPTEQMHLTLKFVGEGDAGLAQSLQKSLDDITHPAFTLDLASIGRFPKQGHPRVLWVGLRENSFLKELQQKVEQKCQQVGIAPEDRAYKPHITLGRVKNGSKQAVNAFINQHKEFAVGGIKVEQFVLYESKLHSDGAKHIRLKTFQLE